MAAKVRLACGKVNAVATFNDTPSARAVLAQLPFDSLVETLPGQVYFSVPVNFQEEDAVEEVPDGTVAYWPAGSAVVIFFGGAPTTPVNVIGTLDSAPLEWRKVEAGDEVKVEKA